MKTKTVKRYYCDFCKKSGQSAGHMRRHEESCTLNWHRVCGVCKILFEMDRETSQKRMGTLLAVLNAPAIRQLSINEIGTLIVEDYSWLDLADLRAATNNCPACIMATIRQAGIPLPAVSGFDFAGEMKAIFACRNEMDANR